MLVNFVFMLNLNGRKLILGIVNKLKTSSKTKAMYCHICHIVCRCAIEEVKSRIGALESGHQIVIGTEKRPRN